jgi:flagellar basal-body rod modification protein FlgD
MAIEAIGGVASTQSATPESLSVSQLDFLRILVTQLSFQDPLKPVDNQEFVAQIAQFTTLEQTRQLNDRVDTLLAIQSSLQSVGIIGKTVEVSTPSGPAQGTVTTVTFANGQPQFTVQLPNLSFLTGVNPATVTLVRDPPPPPAAQPTPQQ